MKKVTFFLAIVLITLNLFSEEISLIDAQVVAQNWYSFISNVENPIISNSETLKKNTISTLYIFNFKKGGFVLTSATNDVIPILGYNDEGEIGNNNGPEFEWLLDGYVEQIYEVINTGIIVQENRDLWQDLTNNITPTDDISIVLDMPKTWNHGSPYNDFVPAIDGTRCPAGCGPVAMAQIINYHKYISDYVFDNEFIPSNYTTDTNEKIQVDEQESSYDFPTFEELDNYLDGVRGVFDLDQHLESSEHLAALGFASGISQKAMYNTDCTGAYLIDTVEGFRRFFGYFSKKADRPSYTQEAWCQLLESELVNSRPICYIASDEDEGAHVFIIHGCHITSSEPAYFFLINWGWGENNQGGYYTLQTLNPGNFSFVNSHSAIYDLKPAALTIAGKMIDGNSFADLIVEVEITCENLTTNQSITADKCILDGMYTIQFNEMPEINTILRIDYQSPRYEDTYQYVQVVDNSNFIWAPNIELFWEKKPIYNNWNWECFPVLDRVNNDPVAAVPTLETISGFDEITDLSVINDYEELSYDPIYSWQGLPYELQSSRCYKIEVLPEIGNVLVPRTIPRTGSLLSEDTTISLLAGVDNWIGYWIKESQDIDDAFGEYFGNVISIKAEDWTYIWDTPRSEPRPSSKIRPLYYEKGYIVRVNEDIPDFHWNITAETPSEFEKKESEFFVYNELPDYEVIDIMEIPQNIIEIGVFQDDVCVGAVVVDEPSEQILVYSDNTVRGAGIISFQLVGNQRSIEHISNYEIMNPNSGGYSNEQLYAGRIDFAQVRFTDSGNQNSVPELNVLRADNYPNPFNPTTIIEFSLPSDTSVQLSVYNLKGQKVKSLLKTDMQQGTHTAVWNGTDNNAKSVSSGVYFFRLKTDEKQIVKKMLLLK